MKKAKLNYNIIAYCFGTLKQIVFQMDSQHLKGTIHKINILPSFTPLHVALNL